MKSVTVFRFDIDSTDPATDVVRAQKAICDWLETEHAQWVKRYSVTIMEVHKEHCPVWDIEKYAIVAKFSPLRELEYTLRWK